MRNEKVKTQLSYFSFLIYHFSFPGKQISSLKRKNYSTYFSSAEAIFLSLLKRGTLF